MEKKILATARQFSLADVVALTAAAALIVIFWFRGRPWIASQTTPLLLALGVTAAFALLAWYAHGVNLTGALAGSAIAFIFAATDVRMFWLLVLVFAITLGATRLGSGRKQRLRTAERKDGRSGSQVMANLGVAGLILALGPGSRPVFVLAMAALAEAAADTASSEVGMAFSAKTVLITSLRSVSPGIDGGISLPGTVAALGAAVAIAAAGQAMGLVTVSQARVVIYAGLLGTLVDSLLGALLERRGWLNNDLVNLLSTAAAGGIAWLL